MRAKPASSTEVTPIFSNALCTTAAVTLEAELQYRQQPSPKTGQFARSDQIAAILAPVRLMLIGTEPPLSVAQPHLFLQVANSRSQLLSQPRPLHLL